MPLASLSSHFTALDWGVLVGYLATVSVLGVVLSGRQRSMRDFFRGGAGLPWYAVSASIIATIISAVTFVAVPALAARDGGDFTYLQLGLIAGLLSRLFVAFVLVPVYWRERVYSPYDFIGQRLGEAGRSVTTAMFTLLGLLAQAARVYLTAVVLELVLRDPLTAVGGAVGVSPFVCSVALVGVIAVAWTLLGGIATVIWTDAMLFLVFVGGGVVALAVIIHALPGGFGQLWHEADAAGKLRLWDFATTTGAGEGGSFWASLFARPYTLWAAVLAVTFGNIGSYGTDQLLAQRIFVCRSQRDAKLAVLCSFLGEAVVALMLLVGVGLWVFYRTFPDTLSGEAGAAVAADPDSLFTVFILTQVPPGLTGLIIAGIFAAAISSLTSILAALSQTSLSAVWLPLRRIDPQGDLTPAEEREVLLVSRGLIVCWGIVLCGVALLINRYVEGQRLAGRDVPLLDLALGLGNYVIGTLLAAFLLAWLPLRVNAYGLIWSAPLSVAMVYASRFHTPAAQVICLTVGGVLIGSWVLVAVLGDSIYRKRRLARTPWLLAAGGLLWLTSRFLLFDGPGGEAVPIAWPWYAPLGGATAFIFGYLLADTQPPPHRD